MHPIRWILLVGRELHRETIGQLDWIPIWAVWAYYALTPEYAWLALRTWLVIGLRSWAIFVLYIPIAIGVVVLAACIPAGVAAGCEWLVGAGGNIVARRKGVKPSDWAAEMVLKVLLISAYCVSSIQSLWARYVKKARRAGRRWTRWAWAKVAPASKDKLGSMIHTAIINDFGGEDEAEDYMQSWLEEEQHRAEAAAVGAKDKAGAQAEASAKAKAKEEIVAKRADGQSGSTPSTPTQVDIEKGASNPCATKATTSASPSNGGVAPPSPSSHGSHPPSSRSASTTSLPITPLAPYVAAFPSGDDGDYAIYTASPEEMSRASSFDSAFESPKEKPAENRADIKPQIDAVIKETEQPTEEQRDDQPHCGVANKSAEPKVAIVPAGPKVKDSKAHVDDAVAPSGPRTFPHKLWFDEPTTAASNPIWPSLAEAEPLFPSSATKTVDKRTTAAATVAVPLAPSVITTTTTTEAHQDAVAAQVEANAGADAETGTMKEKRKGRKMLDRVFRRQVKEQRMEGSVIPIPVPKRACILNGRRLWFTGGPALSDPIRSRRAAAPAPAAKVQADVTEEGVQGVSGPKDKRYVGVGRDGGQAGECAWFTALAKSKDEEEVKGMLGELKAGEEDDNNGADIADHLEGECGNNIQSSDADQGETEGEGEVDREAVAKAFLDEMKGVHRMGRANLAAQPSELKFQGKEEVLECLWE